MVEVKEGRASMESVALTCLIGIAAELGDGGGSVGRREGGDGGGSSDGEGGTSWQVGSLNFAPLAIQSAGG